MAGIASPATAIARQDLAGVAMGFNTAFPDRFVTHQVLRPFMCERRDIRVDIVNPEEFTKRISTRRVRGAGSARDNHTKGDQSFRIDEYSVEEGYDPNDSRYTSPEREERVIVTRKIGQILSDIELTAIAALTNTTTFPSSGNTGLSVGTPWSTTATATPLADIALAQVGHLRARGIFADTLNININQWGWLSRNAQLVGRFQSYNPVMNNGLLPLDQLAQLLHPALKKIVVWNCVTNTANDGVAATPTLAWPDARVLLCKVGEGDDIDTPQIGRLFGWNQQPELPGSTGIASSAGDIDNADGLDITVSTYPEPRTKEIMINVTKFATPALFTNAAGFLFVNIG